MQTVIRFRPSGTVDGVPPIGQVATADGTFEVHADDPTQALHTLTGWAFERGVRFDLLEVPQPTLEDVYLQLTGGEEGVGMSAGGLTLRQVRFTNKSFWRNPASAFFTFAFPLMFLVIFTALLGGGEIRIKGTDLKQTTYYVVAMATFGVISACFTNIAISVCFNRDAGILKRTRGTPLPGWSYLERSGDPLDDRRRDPRGRSRCCSAGPSTTATFPRAPRSWSSSSRSWSGRCRSPRSRSR